MEKKIEFGKAINVANEILEVHEITSFPINMFELFEDYDNLSVISYGELMTRFGKTRREIINLNSSAEGSISYDANSDHYIITYNELVQWNRPKERIYWTLAHEFGHYLLEHNKQKKQSKLTRLSLSSKSTDYDEYEAEADFFARFLINPPGIIEQAKLGTPSKVSESFGVTWTVAKKTLNYINETKSRGYKVNFPFTLKAQLSTYIAKLRFGKTCTTCNSYTFVKGIRYCPTCGESEFKHNAKGDDAMRDQDLFIVTNEHGVAEVCPVCSNNDIVGEYCHVCGNYMINKCTGFRPGELESDRQYNGFKEPLWHFPLEDQCDGTLPSNARFCHKCGATSTYYEDNIIHHWTYDPDAQSEAAATNEPIDISDDDLPF